MNFHMKTLFAFVVLGFQFPSVGWTQETAHLANVRFDALVDTYYAFDFNHPNQFDRAFTTQPARSDEFNLNLAMLGISYAKERVRGRFALQAGTSVQSNYASEPSIGTVSGSSLSRSVQEAYVGYSVADGLWLDAGTYFSHVGAESFISRDNLTYTRSLVADFSPYYQSGVRLSYQANEKLALQLHLVNGWQNVSENNHSKMVGTQVSYQVSPRSNLAYSTLIGREAEFRHFHDFVYKSNGETFDFVAQYDLGFEKNGGEFSNWWGAVGLLRYKFDQAHAIALRAEHYEDAQQLIVKTSVPAGFDVSSFSIGYDQALSSQLLWRTEYRAFAGRNAIFPTETSDSPLSTTDHLAVTSLTLSF